MKKTYYKAKCHLNYRTGPGANYTKVGVLQPGAVVPVVLVKGKWAKFISNNKYYYCSFKYLRNTSDFGDIVSWHILPLAKDVVEHKAVHVSGRYDYDKYEGERVNCSVFVSAILQKVGLLPKGTIIYHTAKDHRKSTVGDCLHNRLKVKHYTWHKTNKTYKDLPSTYKRRGCIYVYASSMAIKGPDHYIYGCHSSGSKYTKLSMIQHKKNTYEFTSPILVVGVPEID